MFLPPDPPEGGFMTIKTGLTIAVATVLLASALIMIPGITAEDSADAWDGTADTAWYYDDQDAKEYHLYTAEQLSGLAEIVNSKEGWFSFEGRTVYLESDINLSGHTWVSIGTGNNASNHFSGTFDGQGHSVSNMTTGKAHHGFFGCVFEATIKNLGVENAEIIFQEDDTSIRTGILADWLHFSTAIRCYTTGIITGNTAGGNHIGGLFGQAMGSSKISECYSSADITSRAYDNSEAIGGLVGSWETNGDDPYIRNCLFNGSISFEGGGDPNDPGMNQGYTSNVGGILGMCFDDSPQLVVESCVVSTLDVEAPSDKDILWNGGMWIAWFEGTGKPTNCFWPSDEREWPAAIAFATYIESNFSDGLYFDEAGRSVADFDDSSIVEALNESGEDVWTLGPDGPTLTWALANIPADTSRLESLIAIADALDPSDYTDFSEVERIVADARSFLESQPDYTQQSVVDAYTASIETAIDNLREAMPPIIWDDDDEYIPPIVPIQPEKSGDDDATTIIACAAAAVVAALMAVFLIMEYRKN